VPEGRILKALKNENDELKAELRRKEKALAEAAALLVLQKSSVRCGTTRTSDLTYSA
jgi:hypothetical protein